MPRRVPTALSFLRISPDYLHHTGPAENPRCPAAVSGHREVLAQGMLPIDSRVRHVGTVVSNSHQLWGGEWLRFLFCQLPPPFLGCRAEMIQGWNMKNAMQVLFPSAVVGICICLSAMRVDDHCGVIVAGIRNFVHCGHAVACEVEGKGRRGPPKHEQPCNRGSL